MLEAKDTMSEVEIKPTGSLIFQDLQKRSFYQGRVSGLKSSLVLFIVQ